MKCASDTAGEGIQFDADEPHALRCQAHESPGAAARLEDRGIRSDPQAGKCFVHGPDYDGRGVEGVEGGAFGRVVLSRGQQREQFLAESLPAGVFIGPLHRVREDPQGQWAEARETLQRVPFSRGRQPVFAFDVLKRADGGEEVSRPGLLPDCHLGEGWRRLEAI